jgi:DedD protein
MRDAHRMKEKYDLSIDNRQIVSILIGGIVVLGAVFVLGVVVGKKLSTGAQASQAPDLLTALDEKAAAMDKPDAQLTFPDELTKPHALPPHVDLTPTVLPSKPEVRTPVFDSGEQDEAPTAAVEAPVVVAAKPKPDEVVPVRTAKDAGGSQLKDAMARAQRPAEAVANGAFTLQLSASQDKTEADRFAARLRDQGYAPYILEATVPGRGTWYRVRMGSFPTKDAATRYLQDFRRETQLEAFVAGPN